VTPEQFLEFARPLPEPVLLTTGQGQILVANPAFTRLLSLHQQPLQAKTLFELATDATEKIKQYLCTCSSSRDMVLGSLTFRISHEETCVCRCEGAVLQTWSPESSALIFLRLKPKESASRRFTLLNQKIEELAKEIRQRKRAEEERAQLLVQEQQARTEAERLNCLKDEFLSTISHELRTPLNAILGWAQILQTSKVDEVRMRQVLETIERNARSQAQLVDDLLDISRIIAGKIRLNVQTVVPISVIEAAMETVQPAAAAKHIRLQSVLDPAAGPILGDSERLQQIIWNLLSNAIKFTPKQGRVQVCLQRINSHIEIIVSDTGQGISPDFLPYIFDRFRQADGSITRSVGGLGLGLAIVRQLVELHGGTVHAESPGKGQGATFMVKLPVMAVGGNSIEPERVHPAVGSTVRFDNSLQLDRLRLLIVDDDADMRELLAYTLEAYGAEVIAAADAAEAIAILTSSTAAINLLISDIGMPDEDGYTLLRRIRALPVEQGGRIPAVALTAYARTQDRTAALLAGFQSHLAKPVEPTELVAVVANLTGRIEGTS
jgi:signal transduction histidine kinase/ActR/RegA family two-component response regulator